MDEEKIKEIYDDLSDNEKFGVAFGMFPIKLSHLSNEECAMLIRLSQKNE